MVSEIESEMMLWLLCYKIVVFMDEAGLPEESHESLKVNNTHKALKIILFNYTMGLIQKSNKLTIICVIFCITQLVYIYILRQSVFQNATKGVGHF